MAILLIFIIIANIVAIALMYYSLGDLGKKEKWIFIGAGIGIMYILTSIVYWISTNGIEMTEVSESGKNLITFLFVPVNGLLILPLLAKSYAKFKSERIDSKIFFNRSIVLAVLLFIILVVECIYFKNIQIQVVELIKQNSNLEKDINLDQDANANRLEEERESNNLESVEDQIDINDNNNSVENTNQMNTISTNEEYGNTTTNILVNEIIE